MQVNRVLVRAIMMGGIALLTSASVPMVTQPETKTAFDGSVPAPGDAEEGEEIQERDEWFYEQRGRSDRFVPRRAYLRAQREASELRRYQAVTGSLRWTEMGPRAIGSSSLPWTYGGSVPYSGRVTSIATHPNDPRTAYIGTSNGGVWKTTNDGTNWTPLFDNQPSLAIGAVAIDPAQPNTVFAGTGEANFGGPAYFGAGLFRSTDGGSSWTKVGGTSFDECHFAGVAVKPGDGRTVLVAVHGLGASVWEGWNNRCADRTGIWRSTDGGTTFTRVLSGGSPSDLAVAPNAANVWYAGFDQYGVWKSTDSGASWRQLTGLPTTGTRRTEIDVVASTTGPTQVIYAAIGKSGSDLAGVFRSRDGGTSWSQLTTPQAHCKGQCNYDLAIAVDRANPERAYFGGVYLNRYVSGVPTLIGWQQIHVDFHAMAFDSSRRLWIGSDGGIYRTADGGTTFANLNSDLGTNLIYPGISGSYGGRVYAGMQDNGTAVYTGARSWDFVNWGDGFFTASNPSNQNPAYVTSQYMSLIKIANNRRCTNLENAGLPDAGDETRAPFMGPVVMHPTNRNVAFVGTYRIFKTSNAASTTCGGTQWSKVSQDFPGWVTAIGPAPSDTSVVYAATQRSASSIAGLYVSRGTNTWTNTAGNGLPNRTVTDISVHPTTPGTAWVTVSGFGGGHVYRTTNFGSSWTNVSGNLPDAPANAVVVDARTSPLTLYVGTDLGVYWSVDGGATWNDSSVGLPNTVVMDLLLDPVADRLIAATFGRGAWSAPARGDGGTGGGGGGEAPSNDAFANASSISPPFSQSGIQTASATVETGEPSPSCGAIGKTLWYRYQPNGSQKLQAETTGSSFDTVLAIYRGTSLSNLLEVACSDDAGAEGGSSKVQDVELSADQTYFLQVGGFRDSTGSVASGTLNLTVSASGATGSNDAFSGATAISSIPFEVSNVSTTNASTEQGEIAPSCASIGKTVWYRYTPAANQIVSFETIGSNFDTVVGVYRGTSLGSLAEMSCDDDGGTSGGSSVVNVVLNGGQTYYIQVGGFYNTQTGSVASGTLSFNARFGDPDPFSGALTISRLPFGIANLSTVNATVQSGEFSPSCASLGRTAWFRYVAPSGGTVYADTSGSNYDTVIGVWRGTSLGSLTEVACDDDGLGSGGGSSVGVNVVAGETYYFQVGGYYNAQTNTVASGNLTFSMQ